MAQDESAGGGEEAGAGIEAGDTGEAGPASEGKDTSKNATAEETLRSWSFGPYFRFVVVPAFMLKLFVDMAPTPTTYGLGAAATYRPSKDGAFFEMGLGYTSYSFSGPFRSKGGEPNDTEIIQSGLGLFHVTGSMLWEAPIVKDTLGFQYGFGLDLGIVTGQLKRTEAFQTADGSWHKCPGPGAALYCNPPLPENLTRGSDPYNVKGEQYNEVQKNIPPLMAFPMLPRVGLRYGPIPDFWVRLDAAYGIAQFVVGLSAAYVPKM